MSQSSRKIAVRTSNGVLAFNNTPSPRTNLRFSVFGIQYDSEIGVRVQARIYVLDPTPMWELF